MKDLNILDKYRLTDQEKKIYGMVGDSGKGTTVRINKDGLLVEDLA